MKSKVQMFKSRTMHGSNYEEFMQIYISLWNLQITLELKIEQRHLHISNIHITQRASN